MTNQIMNNAKNQFEAFKLKHGEIIKNMNAEFISEQKDNQTLITDLRR